jgi:hypothetical protein
VRRLGGALLVAAMLLAQAPGVAASPGGGPNQRFLILGRVEDPTASLIASGPVGGVGTLTAESATFDEPTSSYDEIDVVAVERGTLTVAIHGSFSVWPFTLEPPSCTRWGSLSGTWAITAGGGAFAGATGGGTFTGAFFTFGPRTTGGCDESMIKGFVFGPMTGTVSLPG